MLIDFPNLVTATDNVKVQSLVCRHGDDQVDVNYKFTTIGSTTNIVCTASDNVNNVTRTIQVQTSEWAAQECNQRPVAALLSGSIQRTQSEGFSGPADAHALFHVLWGPDTFMHDASRPLASNDLRAASGNTGNYRQQAWFRPVRCESHLSATVMLLPLDRAMWVVKIRNLGAIFPGPHQDNNQANTAHSESGSGTAHQVSAYRHLRLSNAFLCA